MSSSEVPSLVGTMSADGAAETTIRGAVEAQPTDDVQADPIEDDEDETDDINDVDEEQAETEERSNLPYPTVLDFPDVFVDWKNTTCDRRLSRAARSLLVEKLRRGVFDPRQGQDHLNMGGHDDAEQDSVWTFVERWMQQSSLLAAGSESPKQLSACPLLDAARRDQYRDEEQHFRQAFPRSFPGGTGHAMKAAFPLLLTREQSKSTSTATSTGGSSVSSTPSSSTWVQCGFCGKVFSTRFYLDHHWATSETCQHSRSQQHQQLPPKEVVEEYEHNMICPAVDWCPLVGGMAACHERALRDEPYYDRGSGNDDDHHSSLVQHKWNKILHSIPCEVESIRRDCRSILATCGIPLPDDDDGNQKGGDFVDEDDWAVPAASTTTTNELSYAYDAAATRFCDMLTCPRQQNVWQYLQDETEDYYQWYLSGDGGGNFRSLNHHDEHHHHLWNREMDHHRGLWSMAGILVLTGLAFWIYRRAAHESSSRSDLHSRRSSGLKALTNRKKSYQNPRRRRIDQVKLD